MVDVLIKGFKSTEEAEEFITWYSEQGEQDYYDRCLSLESKAADCYSVYREYL